MELGKQLQAKQRGSQATNAGSRLGQRLPHGAFTQRRPHGLRARLLCLASMDGANVSGSSNQPIPSASSSSSPSLPELADLADASSTLRPAQESASQQGAADAYSTQASSSQEDGAAETEAQQAAWISWVQHFADMDAALDEQQNAKLDMQVAVQKEDYAEAAALKKRMSVLEASDPVVAVQQALSNALAEERYGDAAMLRDPPAAAGLAGWWAGRLGNSDPVGHLLYVAPEYSRWSGRAFTAREISGVAQASANGSSGSASSSSGRAMGMDVMGRGGRSDAEDDKEKDLASTAGTPVMEVFLRYKQEDEGSLVVMQQPGGSAPNVECQAVVLQPPDAAKDAAMGKKAQKPASSSKVSAAKLRSSDSTSGPKVELEEEAEYDIEAIHKEAMARARAGSIQVTVTSGDSEPAPPQPLPGTAILRLKVLVARNGDARVIPLPVAAVKSTFTGWEKDEMEETLRALRGDPDPDLAIEVQSVSSSTPSKPGAKRSSNSSSISASISNSGVTVDAESGEVDADSAWTDTLTMLEKAPRNSEMIRLPSELRMLGKDAFCLTFVPLITEADKAGSSSNAAAGSSSVNVTGSSGSSSQEEEEDEDPSPSASLDGDDRLAALFQEAPKTPSLEDIEEQQEASSETKQEAQADAAQPAADVSTSVASEPAKEASQAAPKPAKKRNAFEAMFAAAVSAAADEIEAFAARASGRNQRESTSSKSKSSVGDDSAAKSTGSADAGDAETAESIKEALLKKADDEAATFSGSSSKVASGAVNVSSSSSSQSGAKDVQDDSDDEFDEMVEEMAGVAGGKRYAVLTGSSRNGVQAVIAEAGTSGGSSSSSGDGSSMESGQIDPEDERSAPFVLFEIPVSRLRRLQEDRQKELAAGSVEASASSSGDSSSTLTPDVFDQLALRVAKLQGMRTNGKSMPKEQLAPALRAIAGMVAAGEQTASEDESTPALVLPAGPLSVSVDEAILNSIRSIDASKRSAAATSSSSRVASAVSVAQKLSSRGSSSSRRNSASKRTKDTVAETEQDAEEEEDATASSSSSTGAVDMAARLHYTRLPAFAVQPSSHPFEGLFMGSFGPHGPELLLLKRRVGADGQEEVVGVKVTGDANVPAGEESFRVKVGPGSRLSAKNVYPDELGIQARFKGDGRTARFGFRNPQWVPGELLQLSANSPLAGGAQLGFVWAVPGQRRFLILLTRVNMPAVTARLQANMAGAAMRDASFVKAKK